MVGLSQDQARKAIRENCANVMKHAHCRKTYKGAAEIMQVPDQVSEESEDEEME
jgi:hypothetical protein